MKRREFKEIIANTLATELMHKEKLSAKKIEQAFAIATVEIMDKLNVNLEEDATEYVTRYENVAYKIAVTVSCVLDLDDVLFYDEGRFIWNVHNYTIVNTREIRKLVGLLRKE